MNPTITVPLESQPDVEFQDLPETTYDLNAGELGRLDMTIDLEVYEDQIRDHVFVTEAEVSFEEVVKSIRAAGDLQTLFDELRRQCGRVELERAMGAE